MRLVLPTMPSTWSCSMSFVARPAICCGSICSSYGDVLDRPAVDAAVVVDAVEVGPRQPRDPGEVGGRGLGGHGADLDRLAGGRLARCPCRTRRSLWMLLTPPRRHRRRRRPEPPLGGRLGLRGRLRSRPEPRSRPARPSCPPTHRRRPTRMLRTRAHWRRRCPTTNASWFLPLGRQATGAATGFSGPHRSTRHCPVSASPSMGGPVRSPTWTWRQDGSPPGLRFQICQPT